MNELSILQIVVFAFAMWFGMYLLGRHPQKAGLRYTGMGMIVYAVGIGVMLVYDDSDPFDQWRLVLVTVIAACWVLALRHLSSDGPTTIQVLRFELPRHAVVLAMCATVFFGLGVGMLILPQDWLSHDWVLLAIGLDLEILGFAVAILDAYDEGESLRYDMLRSFGSTFALMVVLGGQVVLVIAINDEVTQAMTVLLLAILTTAAGLQVFWDAIQGAFDRVMVPQVHEEGTALREVASALPRRNPELNPLEVDEKEFARLTRRALSHLGSLDRLASSPLVELVEGETTLERASQLKVLLTERIERLKPPGDVDYGTSDEWRFYNALYYPYVLGVKPYSRRYRVDDFGADVRDVVQWFAAYVPERTLYNWQTAAAKLIAQDLREMRG